MKHESKVAAGHKLAVAVFAILADPAHAQTITNGEFEDPSAPNNFYSVVEPGSTVITGWGADSPSVIIIDAGYSEGNLTFNSHGGRGAIDLTGEGLKPGSIFIQMPTTNNQNYRLRFWVGNAASDGSGKSYYDKASIVTVYIDGNLAGRFINNDVTMNGVNWKCFSLSVLGTGAVRRIRFAHENVNDNFAGLDDVSISSSPTGSDVTYAYDPLGRLTTSTSTSSDGVGYTASYAYDRAGNRSNVNVAGRPC